MGKWDWGCEWRHARKWWAGILGDFEKKAVSWDLTLDEASWDSDLCESSWVYGMCRAVVGSVSWDPTLGETRWDLKQGGANWFLSLGVASPVGAYGMRRAFVGSDATVSIVKIVSLSLSSCRKIKLKKSISYRNYRKSSVFRDSYAYERSTHPYICVVVLWL